MAQLTPRISAELANEIYNVQFESTLKFFLARPEFSGKAGQKQPLKAEVGSRWFNTRDGFSICARRKNHDTIQYGGSSL